MSVVVAGSVLGSATPAVASVVAGGPPPLHRQMPVPHTKVSMTTRTSPRPPAAGPRAASAWPSAGHADVVLADVASDSVSGTGRHPAAQRRAGRLPVLVGPAAAAGDATPPVVHVRVADQRAARRAGVTGVLFSLGADGSAGSVSVGLDYTGFRNAVGGDWAARLHLVRLPACALTTPDVPSCRTQTPIPSSNANSAVSATVSFGPRHSLSGVPGRAGRPVPAIILAAVAAPSGSNGSFTASKLAPSGSWSVSGASGSFDWSYPIAVPPAASGDLAPDVALSYDSSSVDGRVASTNNQPSWVGEGWDYSPGYIERTYRACRDDPAGTAPKTDDLCWAGQVVTANFGGQSTPLVRDDATGTWHGQADNGERVELLTGADNGARNGEYWRITTTDGTQYYFGRNHGPGWTTQATTHSTWTAPVYGAHSGDPCFNPAGFASSSCAQAWRWNLDYVEDPHGNVAVYYYDTETNLYGADNGTTGVSYVRGGTLARIDYGLRDEAGTVYANPAPDQVVFTTSQRCIPSGTFTCDPSAFTSANASHWPDTPQDQQCTTGATCDNHAPTFWTTRRLTGIATQYYNGTGYTRVDSYALAQEFPTAGDPELFLNSVTRTGYAPDGTSIALPPVSFAGQLMDNRVDGFNSQPPMAHWRLTSITSETGSVIAVTYSQRECTATHVPADPANNTLRCFPVYWTLPFNTTPILDYFHKYVTTEVDVQEQNALSPTQRTTYTYLGAPAWHFDDNELVKPANRTYGQFRGYRTVEVRTGDVNNNNSQGVADRLTLTTTTYFRGMDGDQMPAGQPPRTASVTDSLDETVTDDNAFADTAYEVRTFDGDGGPQVTTTITTPTVVASTGSRARSGLHTLTSTIVATAKTRTLTNLAAGGVRTATTTYRYDSLGRQTGQTDSGDGVPDVCTTTSYADDTAAWIRDHVAETITSAQACPPAGTPPSPVLSDTRTYYDGQTALGALSGPGDPTEVDAATDNTSGTLHFARSTATFDASGRPTSSTVYTSATDPTGRTTSTAYTPGDGGSLTQVVTTNAKAQTTTVVTDPGRGSVTHSVDVAGHPTDATYDALGRLTAVWLPGRSKAADDPSSTYSYLLRSTGPLAVTTRTLVDLTSSESYTTSVSLYDALGQLRQVQTDAEGGGRVVADTFYDSHGWAIRSNNRWFTTGAPDTTLISTADSAVDDRTITTYDDIGRPVLATEYQGLTATFHTQTVYGGDRTTVIPPTGGVTATTLTDTRGHTTEVRQYTAPPTVTGNVVTGGTFVTTGYHYTPLGLQDSITDPDGHIRSFVFDLAGRKTSQTDPDVGTSTFGYDDAGDLTTTTDARGQTLAYTYDVLGRKVGEYSGSTSGTQLAAWTWDTLQKGKLTFSTRFTPTGNYLSGFKGYDGAGRPNGVIVSIPSSETGLSGLYTTVFGITSTGLQRFVEPAPGGGLPAEIVGTSHTPLGHPMSTVGYNDYVDSTAYTPFGEPQQYRLNVPGSQTQITFDRDAQTRRVTGVNLSGHTVVPQIDNTTYTYDPAGNITRTVDAQGDTGLVQTTCYRYDALARLAEAWSATDQCVGAPTSAAGSANIGGASPFWTSWSFDPAGLRTGQTQHGLPGQSGGDAVTAYSYGNVSGGQPDTLTGTATTGPAGASGTSYGFDAAGNTTSRDVSGGSQTLSWDAENRLAGYTAPAGLGSYVYDADGNVLIRRDPGSTTLFLPGEEFTRTADGTVTGTRYYSHGDTVVAMRVGGANPTYVLGDSHGTMQVAVGSESGTVTRRLFDPYGNPLGQTTGGTWPDSHGFLNKSVDAVTGLIELGARDYDPATGVFISPDPLLDSGDPQSLNGYGYADGNPVTMADPSGLTPCMMLPVADRHACEGSGEQHGNPPRGGLPVLPHGTMTGTGRSGKPRIGVAGERVYELPPGAPKVSEFARLFDTAAGRFEQAGWGYNAAYIAEAACDYQFGLCSSDFIQRLMGDGWAIDNNLPVVHGKLLQSNWKQNALETAGALAGGIIPARGIRVGKPNQATSAVSGRNLGRQLASEQQMGEPGRPIAGSGTSKRLRVAGRLAREYGGSEGDWTKMGSTSYRGADGVRIETHWYEDSSTGMRVEFKTKVIREQ